MITKLTIRKFKQFNDVSIDLGSPVVFVGPNNSGKTSAIQALALWELGLRRWNEKNKGRPAPEKRPGVTVNCHDLLAIPHPSAKHLWKDLKTRASQRIGNKQGTRNVLIEIVVEGLSHNKAWTCGLEFDFANAESVYCRPLRLTGEKQPQRMPVPDAAESVKMAYLPPMSGLEANEVKLEEGAVNVRIGEGRTAEVLRNLCLSVSQDHRDRWTEIVDQIQLAFGVKLSDPNYVAGRGEITLSYTENKTEFDISSSGRGLQQTLLILAYMYAHQGSVILLDEPDVHLEALRQRAIYNLIVNISKKSGGQVIAATHSAILINEAAEKDTVITFYGAPRRLVNGSRHVRKALSAIGYDQLCMASQTGWVLYLQGSTDLDILQAFAKRLGHDRAAKALERPFVHHINNQPRRAEDHFQVLKEAQPDLRGIAIINCISPSELPRHSPLPFLVWKKCEIENYIATKATLKAFARASDASLRPVTAEAMDRAIDEVTHALDVMEIGSPWDPMVKASDDVLKPIFSAYFRNLDQHNTIRKRDFHELVQYIPDHEIDPEILQKLDAIASVAEEVAAIRAD